MLIQKRESSITFLIFKNERLERQNVSNETIPDQKLAEIRSETKPGKKPTKMPTCLQNISQTGTIHQGIFRRKTL